jgi:hypothetical protein
MTPGQTLINRMVNLLASDATTLAPAANAVKVHLASAAFVPSPALIVGNFTEATFVGYAALLAGLNAQQVFFDPSTGNQIIQLIDPAGGWHWQTTGAAGLPQTIYGWYVTDNGVATVYGSQLLSAPLTLTVSGQGVDVSFVRLTFPPIPMT